MYKTNNFDNWLEDESSGKFGSGASEKIWLIEPFTEKTGLFKYPKIKDKDNNIITGEFWAEKLSSELAMKIGISSNKIDIGYYKGRIGTMSYNMTNCDSEGIRVLTEGVAFIEKKYPDYNKDKLLDEKSGEKYSLQMIKKCIPEKYFNSILQMILFDALIGNSDRHHSNWGIIYELKNNEINDYFSPLYDNGSSLCAYVNDDDIDKLFKDKMMYSALLDTKSKSTIGWKEKRPIRHFELLENIRKDYYNETINFVKSIKNNITNESVSELLNNFSEEIIPKEKKNLLLKFILDRRNKILDIYNMEDEDDE